MEPIKVKTEFPIIRNGNTVCPFCGDVCFETVGSETSCAADSVHVYIGFHCANGCCCELHLVSEEGELHPHCVLRGVHEELGHKGVSERLASC